METMLAASTHRTAGILLLSIATIEWGGLYLLRVTRGRVPVTDFQRSFHRAGHAHAGVLVILSLVSLLYVDVGGVAAPWSQVAASAIPASALLIPGGFFFSSLGRGVTSANRWVVLIHLGVVSLAVGVVSLGIGLLVH